MMGNKDTFFQVVWPSFHRPTTTRQGTEYIRTSLTRVASIRQAEDGTLTLINYWFFPQFAFFQLEDKAKVTLSAEKYRDLNCVAYPS